MARDFYDAIGESASDVSTLDEDALFAAADAWREHRAVEGRHKRITAEFLIGAHALLRAPTGC